MSLTPAFRKELEKVLKEYPGSTRLGVNLYDAASGYRIEMVSKKFQVTVCQDLLLALDKMGVSYSVIK